MGRLRRLTARWCIGILPKQLYYYPMQADELAFFEEMMESAELLDCSTCGEETLHVHEQVLSVEGGVTEVLMRCSSCMSCRPHVLVDLAPCKRKRPSQ